MSDDDQALDAFGEDDGPDPGADSSARVAAPARTGGDGAQDRDAWYMESQRAWEFGGQHCMLICLESGDGVQLRFEILKKNMDKLTVTCTRQQFQDLCDERKNLAGPARANAAIRQLFQEGLQELPQALPHGAEIEEDKQLDAFGEDDDADASTDPVGKTASGALRPGKSYGADGDAWYMESQRSWELHGEHCTLTCLEGGDGEHLRFEVLKSNCDTITVTCSRQQFQAICEEQRHLSGPARVDAAIRQIFKEGLEECPKSAPVAQDAGRQLKDVLKGWSRCDGGLVALTDMKALLKRLNPECAEGVLELILAPGAAGSDQVNVDALVDSILRGPMPACVAAAE